MKNKIIALSFMTVLLSSACSTMTPARYSISVGNNLELKKYDSVGFAKIGRETSRFLAQCLQTQQNPKP